MNGRRRRVLKFTALGAAVGLLGTARAQSGSPSDAKAMFERLAKDGKGFDMLPSLGPREPVFVVFDPQCRFCVRLWEAAKPIARQVRFVWVPVALVNGRSEPQAAAILSAADPVAAMEAHEGSFASGGLAVGSMKIHAAARSAVSANTLLFRRSNGSTVPTSVFRHRGTGEYTILAGALDSEGLRRALGIG